MAALSSPSENWQKGTIPYKNLLLQCLARLVDEPRVLHGDHRLRREILQQCDLLVGKRVRLPAVDGDDAEQSRTATEGHGGIASNASDVDQRTRRRRADAIGVVFNKVRGANDVLAPNKALG